ncbi:hypothetical protein BDW72DRAFT_186816 [Aspergillus terricola var. indicus]
MQPLLRELYRGFSHCCCFRANLVTKASLKGWTKRPHRFYPQPRICCQCTRLNSRIV